MLLKRTSVIKVLQNDELHPIFFFPSIFFKPHMINILNRVPQSVHNTSVTCWTPVFLVMMHVSMKLHGPDKKNDVFDTWPPLVTLILDIGTYKWNATHHLVMMHASMKFHEILFKRLDVVVRTKKKAFWPKMHFYLWPLLVTFTLSGTRHTV